MKQIRRILITILAVSITLSCNDVLDETPDNRTTIDSAEKIAELLVGAYPEAAYVPFLEPMSDNAGDKSPSAEDNAINREMFFWRDYLPDDDDTPTYYWNQAYKAISQANQALASIEQIGNDKELNALKGEALLCRAYAHFMLVSMYSKAYDPGTAGSDLGIPYVTEPERVLIKSYERGTVESVYNNIQADLEAGLLLIEDNYTEPAFHFTKAAANAFASRFYLNKGEWQKVIDHSTAALGVNPRTKLRDWEANYRTATVSEQRTLFTSAVSEPANLLMVSANSLYSRNHWDARYQLNTAKRDEIFPSENATGKQWSYVVYGSNDLYYNIPKFQEYFRVTNQAAGIGFAFTTFVLLTTDEALLNRAEAYAMLGQFDQALADINMSYAPKTRDYSVADALTISDVNSKFQVDNDRYTPFYSIPEAARPFVHAVLTIKRTVFYNEGMRWFDNKRHNMEITHMDVNQNTFILTKTDLRRQIQIPEAAQVQGITANPR